ncbi:MAG: SOS response-associated peptidase [Candidatus Melainabacteria bacterium]|nr:SOS response-associated peptidase [Candidatus Melainabacteria bacterium]
MCGRYTIAHNHKEIMERFGIEQMFLELDPRYNVAPSQMVPVVIETKATDDMPAVRVLETSKWGLVPGFVQDAKLIKPMINARGETLLEKRMFKNALFKRRCLIPADGFFEWMAVGKKRQPVRFQVTDGALFAMAGLYEERTTPEGELIERTCTIITVAANEKVSPVHSRMPAILKPDDEALWLSKECGDPEKLLSLLNPYDNDAINFYRVSATVNNARSDSAECIAPVDLEAEAAAEAATMAAFEEAKAARAAKTATRRAKSTKVAETSDVPEQAYLSDELRELNQN